MATAQQAVETCSRCSEPLSRHRPSAGCPYNGWRNYETWCVGLWIDNEEPSYKHAHRLARQAVKDSKDQRAEHETCAGFQPGAGASLCTTCHEVVRTPEAILADALKEYVEESMPDLGASMFADLLNAAFGEVEWYDLAEHFLTE